MVNRDSPTNQVLALQAEIQSLRDELLQAQSTHTLHSGSTQTLVTDPTTVDSSLNTEVSLVLPTVTLILQLYCKIVLHVDWSIYTVFFLTNAIYMLVKNIVLMYLQKLKAYFSMMQQRFQFP